MTASEQGPNEWPELRHFTASVYENGVHTQTDTGDTVYDAAWVARRLAIDLTDSHKGRPFSEVKIIVSFP